MRRDFDQLRLRKRCDHPDDRFVLEEDSAFGYGIDIAGKAQACDVIDEAVSEPLASQQPVDLVIGELQALEKVERLLEPRGHQEASARRKPAHEELEHGRIRLAMVQIGLEHVQLIQIGQQRACRGIHEANLGLGPLTSLSYRIEEQNYCITDLRTVDLAQAQAACGCP